MLYRITWWKNTVLAIFLRWQWQLRTHIGGTIAPWYIRWWERKFQGAKVPGCESSKERKFQGAKVPHLELSLPGANGLASEKSIIHKQVGLQLKQWNHINGFVQSTPIIYSRPLCHYSAQNSLILILPSHEGYVRIKYRKFLHLL